MYSFSLIIYNFITGVLFCGTFHSVSRGRKLLCIHLSCCVVLMLFLLFAALPKSAWIQRVIKYCISSECTLSFISVSFTHFLSSLTRKHTNVINNSCYSPQNSLLLPLLHSFQSPRSLHVSCASYTLCSGKEKSPSGFA